MRFKNTIKTLSGGINTLNYSALAILGERMQYFAHEKLLKYNWLTGHLSDFASSVALGSLFYTFMDLGNLNTKDKLKAVIGAPSFLTLVEILGSFSQHSVFDIQDVLLYYVGTGFGVILTELNKTLLNNMINHSSLEYKLNELNNLIT